MLINNIIEYYQIQYAKQVLSVVLHMWPFDYALKMSLI